MAKRTILTGNNPTLRKKSREVTVFDARLHQLLDDMVETLHQANGVGLAAVQVGVLRRAIVIDVYDDEGPFDLINPRIVEESEEMQTGAEGCLSFPGEYGRVSRPMRVTVEALDRNGNLIRKTGEGLLARAFCHEIDHLNGIIYKDLATEMLDGDEDDEE